jgi:DNA-binding SARP family transcriptional activator/ABC-type branched-subunit amino acid transport system substrate-binding protein/DNA-binding beta-propeller fold protein YncE
MEFRVLGPLEVLEEGRGVEIGGRTPRVLLAVLLLHANEVVSRDRLIDELWGDSPPATAVKTLQAHVSRLRATLNGSGATTDRGHGMVETLGQGYCLRIEPGAVDADRFRGLLEEGRGALGEGEAERAAQVLREALGLWRGPALADLSNGSFASAEIARLDELRLEALEERIDADLALGRHAALVGELEALVGRHPLRERLRGQLMLSLYRSGRQAQALRVYQDGRHSLAEELGLDPGPALRHLESQILKHDPALAPPEPRRAIRTPARRSRRTLVLVGVLVLVAAIAAVTLQALLDDGATQQDAAAAAIDAPGAGLLHPGTGALLKQVPLGTTPSTIAAGVDSVWVLDANDRTISRVDPTGHSRVRTFSTASTPTDLAIGANAIWVGNGFPAARFGDYPRSVSRLDPVSGVVDETIALPNAREGQYLQGGGFTQQHIAATREAVWVVDPDLSVSRIDPRSNQVVATVEGVEAGDIAAGPGGVWFVGTVGGGDEGVVEIDPATNAVSQRIEVAAESLATLAVGGGAVWAADPLGGSVWRIDPGPDPVLHQIPLDLGVRSVAFGHGFVWATNEISDRVYRIDPRTNVARVVSHLAAPQRVAVGQDGIWVTALGPPERDESLPAASCSPVFARAAARPRFLIVSDLPLQGDRPITRPMVEGIRFVLEQRGFRAGRYSVGYQSCDDSTAQAGGTDVYRCFANARAYARNLDVVGVIGAYHSFCSAVEIPIANQAADGPLAMISPSNTVVGLTRPYRGMQPGELSGLYPTGKRNYVRIAAADHLAAVALVEAARELGRKRLFVLWDRADDDTAAFADSMRRAARDRSLTVAGAAGWDPQARSFRALAQRVAAGRPEAVLMGGAAPPHRGALIRDLRAALGRRVALVTSDGFAAFDDLIAAAGSAARGMYVGTYGVPDSKLPPSGRRFLRRFERATGGRSSPDFTAAYGAQAAQILLGAIARSDGTRASVTHELRRTRVDGGILGSIRFDDNGDLVEGPVTIFRVSRNGPVVDRVISVGGG